MKRSCTKAKPSIEMDKPMKDARSLSTRRQNRPIDAKPRIGRLQLRVRRAFIASNGQPLTIADFLPRCYPQTRSYARWQYRAVGRAACKFGVSLGRAESRQGRPIVWAPNAELARLINGGDC